MKLLTKLLVLSGLTAAVIPAAAQSDSTYLDSRLSGDWGVYSETAQVKESPEGRWWKRFNDPLLDSLIEVGLQRNYDVAMATRRIDIARAAVGTARASYFPTFNLGIGYTRDRASGRLTGATGQAATTSYMNGTVSMSWEIDVFGKITQQVKSKRAAVQVSRAERAGVKVSLEAQIADAYVSLRVKQAQIKVANEHSASQLKALKIAEARFETGLASMLDVDQARTVYYNTIASIPMLESSIHTSINAIAVLLAENPENLYEELSTPAPLPSYIQLVATGVPADLLRRRPDVVQAEEEIAVYAAELGIAKKDYLPTLTINGSVGTAAHRLGDLFDGPAFTYNVAPTLSWTIFDGMARRHNLVAAKQNMQIAIDNYNLTVMTAFQETDNALSTYFANIKYIKALDDLVSSSRDYDRLSLDQYKNGLTAYINVANAQMSYLTYQNTILEARGQALSALIDLYKALGGGWHDTELRDNK